LLSSHIEGYIKDVGEVAIERIALRKLPKSKLSGSFRYHLSHDLINEIKNTNDPSKIAIKVDTLFQRDGHIWGTDQRFSGTLPASLFLANFAIPNHEHIRKFFNRFGYQHYNSDLERRLASNYQPCRNMVDQVVDQRNAIAHGDMVMTGTPTDLAQMIALVKQYCREADHVVGNWFSSQRCTIR
jgi:regulatory protein YycH of two-component signal transduction system YycFG